MELDLVLLTARTRREQPLGPIYEAGKVGVRLVAVPRQLAVGDGEGFVAVHGAIVRTYSGSADTATRPRTYAVAQTMDGDAIETWKRETLARLPEVDAAARGLGATRERADMLDRFWRHAVGEVMRLRRAGLATADDVKLCRSWLWQQMDEYGCWGFTFFEPLSLIPERPGDLASGAAPDMRPQPIPSGRGYPRPGTTGRLCGVFELR